MEIESGNRPVGRVNLVVLKNHGVARVEGVEVLKKLVFHFFGYPWNAKESLLQTVPAQ